MRYTQSDRHIDDLIGSIYREKIDKVKKEFGRAKDSFDRSVELEILVAVDGIGEHVSYVYCCFYPNGVS